MEFHPTTAHILILMAGYFLASVIDAVSGGGGLIMTPLYIAIGVPVHNITSTSQVVMAPGSLLSIFKFNRSGMIYWRCALMTIPFGLIGSFLGSRLNMSMSDELLKKVLVFLIPIIAVISLVKKDFGSEDHFDLIDSKTLFLLSAVSGLAIGTYQGFCGMGAGTFYLLFLCILDKMDMVHASGTTKPLSFAGNISAAVTYALSGKVLWMLVPFGIISYSAGSYLGSVIAVKGGAKIIRPVFICVLVGMFVKVLFDVF